MVVEQAARDHRFGAFDDLFRRLEDEEVLAADVADALDERAGDPDHDRHVRVVATRVHASVDLGVEVDA